jgi:hypothetical protein
MSRPKKKRAVLSDDDIRLLSFLWKWKVSTTAALAARFYPHKNLRRAYNRLLVLEKTGIIQSRADIRGERYLWTLTREGYRRIRHTLPSELEEEGFESKALGHDLLCSAVLAGDWLLLKTPPDLIRVTEQQLSRLKKTDRAMPDYEGYSDHRSDGYWYYKATKKLIGLEVQISRQKIRDYQRVGEFYEENPQIETVLWVVSEISLARSILKGLAGYGKGTKKHNFVSFDNFFKNGYEALIEEGEMKGLLSIHQLLCGNLKDTIEPAKDSEKAVRKLLDVRKSPHIAKNERYFAPGDHW